MPAPPPPFEQIKRDIIERVRTGELRPGDRLPTIRALAEDLSLAANTVARAYKGLEEARIVTTRRGSGTVVASEAPARAREAAAAVRREEGGTADPTLVALLADPIAAARAQGHGELEILAAVRAVLARP
ncbi:GntR family transcriptional regulator [Brachybacterium sp. YJGR34]|uniref:GntR family transcriptional regulator n=1 Tax=Brachybacterium sp. YJGR34 TaxID=2059911 RepID=UPI000E0A8535|nr:GntR family transcriptional regulator [Brachybacterium sp. YJGR34]